MFVRWIEDGLTDVLEKEGVGCIAFSPLAQGLLTDKYLDGIPEGSRAASPHGFLQREEVTRERIAQVRKLNDVARERGQTLAQMALRWVLSTSGGHLGPHRSQQRPTARREPGLALRAGADR